MMEKKLVVPVGFRFEPSEDELINMFLWPKIMGQRLPCEAIKEKQLYAGNPWDILDEENNKWIPTEKDGKGNTVKKTLYVFTRLTKKAAATGTSTKNKGERKEQFVRTAGDGTWDGQTRRKAIKKGNKVIGFMKMLVFRLNPKSNVSHDHNMGHYIVHEYSTDADVGSGYVLCEIIHDLKKRTKRKRGPVVVDEEGDDDDQEIMINPKRLMTSGGFDNNRMINVTYSGTYVHDHSGASSSTCLSTQYSQGSVCSDEGSMPICIKEWDMDALFELADQSEDHQEGAVSGTTDQEHVLMTTEADLEQTHEWDEEGVCSNDGSMPMKEWDMDALFELVDDRSEDHQEDAVSSTADQEHVLMTSEADVEQTQEWDEEGLSYLQELLDED